MDCLESGHITMTAFREALDQTKLQIQDYQLIEEIYGVDNSFSQNIGKSGVDFHNHTMYAKPIMIDY